MNAENPSCQSCFLKASCPPNLQPERLRPNGTISKAPLPPIKEACRHTTCDDGMQAALIAKSRGGVRFTLVDRQNTMRDIVAAAFGTPDKPTHLKPMRIIDTETDEIYSEQDGIFYPTGQRATLWF